MTRQEWKSACCVRRREIGQRVCTDMTEVRDRVRPGSAIMLWTELFSPFRWRESRPWHNFSRKPLTREIR